MVLDDCYYKLQSNTWLSLQHQETQLFYSSFTIVDGFCWEMNTCRGIRGSILE
jgi:predicted secreted protein